MVCVSLCQSTPKLSSHPRAPRLHPTHSTLVPSPVPCCPHGPQHSQGQAQATEPANLQHSSLQINDLRPAVGSVCCSKGDPHKLSHSQTTELHSSFSFTPLQLAGDCMVPGQTVATTHTAAGRCFSIPCSFLYPLASSLDQGSCTPKAWGLRVPEGSGTSAQFSGSF